MMKTMMSSMAKPVTGVTTAHHQPSITANTILNGLILNKFCSCLELWKGCILAGIFTMSTSIFDLLWSVAHMIDEDSVAFFYLLFALGIESVIFMATSGLLFIALIKKSKCLLLPWLVMAFMDVFFSLMIAFAELAIPSTFNTQGCTVPAISMVVTLLVCFITIYCWLCVYGQYLSYAKSSVHIAEIKVTPIDDLGRPDSSRPGGRSQMPTSEHPGSDPSSYNYNAAATTLPPVVDTLKVPQVSTPRDAW